MSKKSPIRYFRFLFLLLTIFILMGGMTLAASDKRRSYDDGRHGWWWYEDPQPKDKDDKKEVKPVRVLPQMKDYTPESLWNMHPDDFQPLVKDFLKKAVQTPTIENVRDFYVMVDISRMKSHVFQNVAGAVWQKYPELSLNSDLPNAALGRYAKLKMSKVETESKISASSNDFALVYFYADGCEFCKAQDEIMAFFTAKYPAWEIKRVEIHERPDLAERFDVKITPYLMLIYRQGSEHFPVAAGVSSTDEVEDRIYRGIRLLSGEINPESYTMYDFQKGGKMDPAQYIGTGTNESNQ